MRISVFTLIILVMLVLPAYGDPGLIHVKSAHDVKHTADRLETVLQEKGMTVFLRVNHGEGARQAGTPLRPTEMVIFGNPKVGAPLMQCRQSVGIDLPQKALIWEDESRKVWLTYNDPQYLARRHDIKGCEAVIAKVKTALKNFARAATQP